MSAERTKEAPSLETHGYTLPDIGAQQAQNLGFQLGKPGLMAKMPTLLQMAEFRVSPQSMGLRVTEDEGRQAIANLGQALYELSDSKFMGIDPRLKIMSSSEVDPSQKPLSATMTIPNIIVAPPEGVDTPPAIVEATPGNIMEAHKNLFFERDPETANLMGFIKHSDSGFEAPNLSFVNELVDTPPETLEDLKDRIQALNASEGYKLEVREMDLGTAVQSAIQRTAYGDIETSRKVVLLTNATGPNGKKIAVVSFPRVQVILREVENIEHAAKVASWGDDRYPVTSLVIERPLLD